MSKFPGRVITDLAPAGYSVFFDGTGDYLSVANNAALQFGSGDFTIEFWWYPNVTSDQNLISKWNSSTEWILQWRSAGNFRWAANGSVVRDANYTLSAGAWIHVAVSCASTNLRIFVNGAQIGTTATQSSITNTSEAVTIGAGQISSTPLAVNGYISNVRIIKGTALYTAAFTPPTQLFPVTNTSLLTCQSPTIIDNSSNAFAITANGNAAVSTFTPFTAYVPYNPALGASTPGIWTVDEAMQAAATRQWNMYDPSFNLTTLLLHGNGTNTAQNNTFLDSSSNNFTITRNPASGPNAPTQGSFSPFSQTGWSNFFTAASSQFISLPNNAAFQFGAPSGNTNDFVVEFFVYPTTTAISAPVHTGYTSGTTYWGFNLNRTTGGVNTAGHVQFYLTDSFNVTATTGLISNQQNHICAVRTGTTVSLFVNGVRQATGTSSVNPNPTGLLYVGGEALSLGRYLDGYVSNLRIIKGATLPYDANALSITVPTSQLTAITGTTVLTCQSNRFVDNSTNNFTISTSGTPSVQAFSPFYPTAAYTPETIGGSGYFDGTGDYLRTPSITIGTNAFCFECWFYPTAAQPILAGFFAATTNNALQLSYTNTGAGLGIAQRGVAFRVTGSSIPVVNQWNHIAFVRSGTGSNQTSIFLNGVRIANGTASDNFSASAYDIAYNSGDNAYLTGYISGARLTNGSTPYDATLSTLTIPTAPPTTSASNTVLLLNFTNAGITDATAKNDLETVGNAQISTTQSKFGGSSIFFDGTGDSLATAPSQLFNLGASDFTIEFWIYPANFSAVVYPLYSTSARAKTDVLALEMGTGGTIAFYATASGGGVWSIASGAIMGTLTVSTWNHVALVRNGSSFRGYVNGVQSASLATNSSALASFDGFNIGTNGAGGGFLNGYMDDLRITRFARYTAAFTPQTSQWQDQ